MGSGEIDHQMSTELKWIASLPASALHAAFAVFERRTFVDGGLQQAAEKPSRKLVATIDGFRLQAHKLLPHLAALSAGMSTPSLLAETSLLKVSAVTAKQHAPRLAEVVRQLITAFRGYVPDVLEQLELRSGPIRQQWEARGPGLLNQIATRTEPELIVPQVELALVHPALGGASRACLPYNSVLFEALIADAHDQLPETVRLAWSIAQLNCDLPKHQGDLKREQISEVAALAMIPATLTAAQEVELARFDPATVQLAIDSWIWPRPTNAKLAEQLTAWWETYSASRPSWAVALGALHAMIDG
jgi:hypothetical protein